MRVLTLNPDCDPSDLVCRIQFAPDGRAFAALVGQPRFITSLSVWDLAAGREAHNVWTGAGSGLDEYAGPAVSPDLTRVAYHAHQDTASVDYVVVETVGGGPQAEVGGDDEEYGVLGLAFAPDGQTLLAASAGADGPRLVWWDVAVLLRGGPQAATTAEGGSLDLAGEPDALAWSPAGAVVAVGLATGEVVGLDPETGHTAWEFRPKRGRRRREPPPPRRLAFAPDGRRLAVVANGGVTVWAVAPGRFDTPLAELTGPKPLTDVGWSPDGRTLATAGADGAVVFWAADGFAERARFDWRVGPLGAVAFAPDGLTCAAGAARGRVVWWDLDG
jgi:WD40 repeat protein